MHIYRAYMCRINPYSSSGIGVSCMGSLLHHHLHSNNLYNDSYPFRISHCPSSFSYPYNDTHGYTYYI